VSAGTAIPELLLRLLGAKFVNPAGPPSSPASPSSMVPEVAVHFIALSVMGLPFLAPLLPMIAVDVIGVHIHTEHHLTTMLGRQTSDLCCHLCWCRGSSTMRYSMATVRTFLAATEVSTVTSRAELEFLLSDSRWPS